LIPETEARLSNLMKAAQEGDRQAYELLLTEVATLVRTYARKRLPQWESVEDIVQETLLSVHQHRHTYDPRRPFSRWLYAIAYHRLIDFVRKQKRKNLREVSELTGFEEAIDNTTHRDAGGLFPMLYEALSRLSTRQQKIVRMLKLDELSVKEISTQTGMSESLVKVTAHRGYKNLRKLLERHK
jgi:RNA polymerase sigma-70 factor (ECF subfamily)